MTEIYKIDLPGIPILKKRLLKIQIIIVLVAVSAGIGFSLFNQPTDENSWITSLLAVVLISIAVTIGFYLSNKKQNQLLNNYELIISEHAITKRQPPLPDISIEFTAIKSIKKNKKGIFIIEGRSFDRIYIPAQIERHEQLEESLNRIKTIEDVIKPINRKLLWIGLSITVIIIATAFITFNSVLLYLAVTLVMGYFLWAFIYAGLSKIISKNYVVMICFAFIYIYVLTILRIYDKDHPGPFQLNQSGKVSNLLDSTRLTFPEYATPLKGFEYKANRETEWVIDLYRLDNTAITEKILETLFDKEWKHIYPSYLYVFSNMEKKWILAYAADSTDTFDSLQVGVSLVDTYTGKNPNFSPALLDNYVTALNSRIARGPAKLQLVTKESSATAVQRAQTLVSIYNKFNKEVSISLQTKDGFRGKEVWRVLQRTGLTWNADYLFEWTNNSAVGESNHFTVETSTDPGYFSEELNEKGMRPKNLIFKFSIPISVDPEHVFDIMVHTALYCQSELGGELVNIYMQPLDTVAERSSISALVKQLKQQGVVPGSEKALSIF